MRTNRPFDLACTCKVTKGQESTHKTRRIHRPHVTVNLAASRLRPPSIANEQDKDISTGPRRKGMTHLLAEKRGKAEQHGRARKCPLLVYQGEAKSTPMNFLGPTPILRKPPGVLLPDFSSPNALRARQTAWGAPLSNLLDDPLSLLARKPLCFPLTCGLDWRFGGTVSLPTIPKNRDSKPEGRSKWTWSSEAHEKQLANKSRCSHHGCDFSLDHLGGFRGPVGKRTSRKKGARVESIEQLGHFWRVCLQQAQLEVAGNEQFVGLNLAQSPNLSHCDSCGQFSFSHDSYTVRNALALYFIFGPESHLTIGWLSR